MKKSHLGARVMACTVQLLRNDAYCPIKVEIRAVDSQSDLRILLWYHNHNHNHNNNNILCLPLAVFIALMLVGPSKCLKQISGLRIPSDQRQTSWLFTSVTESGFELGNTENKSS